MEDGVTRFWIFGWPLSRTSTVKEMNKEVESKLCCQTTDHLGVTQVSCMKVMIFDDASSSDEVLR